MLIDITAQQVVDRIQKNLGVPWKSSITDVFEAGGHGLLRGMAADLHNGSPGQVPVIQRAVLAAGIDTVLCSIAMLDCVKEMES
jgi:hypothetical protein